MRTRVVTGLPGIGTARASVRCFLEITNLLLQEKQDSSRVGGGTLPVHISASWARARRVRAAVDLSDLPLDFGSTFGQVHSISSLCQLRLTQLQENAIANNTYYKSSRVESSWSYLEWTIRDHLDSIFPTETHRIWRKPADPSWHVSSLLNEHSRLCAWGVPRDPECIEFLNLDMVPEMRAALLNLQALWDEEGIVPAYAVAEKVLALEREYGGNVALFPWSNFICDDMQDWTKTEIDVILSMATNRETNRTRIATENAIEFVEEKYLEKNSVCTVHGFLTPSAAVFQHRKVAPWWYFEKKARSLKESELSFPVCSSSSSQEKFEEEHSVGKKKQGQRAVQRPEPSVTGSSLPMLRQVNFPLLLWRGSNDSSHNDSSHNDTSHNDSSHNDSSHNDSSHNDTSHNDSSHNDTSHHDLEIENVFDTDRIIPSVECGHFETFEDEMDCVLNIVTANNSKDQGGVDAERKQQGNHQRERKIAVVSRRALYAANVADHLEISLMERHSDKHPLSSITVVRFGTVRRATIWTEYESVRALLGMLEACLSESFNGTSQRLFQWIQWVEKKSNGYGFDNIEKKDSLIFPISNKVEQRRGNEILQMWCQEERSTGLNLLGVIQREKSESVACDEVLRDIMEVRRLSTKAKGISSALRMLMTRRGRESDGEEGGFDKLLSLIERCEQEEERRTENKRKRSRGNRANRERKEKKESIRAILNGVLRGSREPGSMSSTGYSTSRGMRIGSHLKKENNLGGLQWMTSLEEELELEWEMEHGGTTRAGENLLSLDREENNSGDQVHAFKSEPSFSSSLLSGMSVESKFEKESIGLDVSIHVMTMHALMDIAMEEYDTVIVVGAKNTSLPGNVSRDFDNHFFVNSLLSHYDSDNDNENEEVGSENFPWQIVYKEHQHVEKSAFKNRWKKWNRARHVDVERKLLLSCLARASSSSSSQLGSCFIVSSGDGKRSGITKFVAEMSGLCESEFRATATSAASPLQPLSPPLSPSPSTRNSASLSLSHSSIESYVSCPKKYEFSKIKKIPSERGSPIMVYGSAMHHAVEFYWRRRRTIDTESNQHEENLRACLDEFRRVWWDCASPLLYGDQADKVTSSNDVFAACAAPSPIFVSGGTRALTTFAPKSMHDEMGEQGLQGLALFVARAKDVEPPDHVEVYLKANVNTDFWRTDIAKDAAKMPDGDSERREEEEEEEDDEDDEWWEKTQERLENVELVGIIDALWEAKPSSINGELGQRKILEYKSNCLQNPLGKSKVRNLGRTSRQPRIYGMLALAGEGKDAEGRVVTRPHVGVGVSARVHGIEGGWEERAPLDIKSMKDTLGVVAQVADGIRNEMFLPKANFFSCQWCGYRDVCDTSAWKL